MTEAEWRACTDPQKMLDFLGGKASDRKLRLFACGCCRHAWGQAPHLIAAGENEIEAIAVAERFADGSASQDELLKVFLLLERGKRMALSYSPARFAVAARIAEEVETCAAFAIYSVEDDGVDPDRERGEQASLLRCICGNPYRPVSLNSAWLTWNDGTIPKLAQAVYAERTFDRLPILADALEEAGCDTADILSHLRGPGPHTRGCWPLDLILGKG
jgi:hypothetical protein